MGAAYSALQTKLKERQSKEEKKSGACMWQKSLTSALRDERFRQYTSVPSCTASAP